MIKENELIYLPEDGLEDDEGNEYFICPLCEGSGIACEGATMDFGDDETPMVVPIEPDWPCGACDGNGSIQVNSENHFCCIYRDIFKIIQNSFGQKIIDELPPKKFKQFYNGIHKSMKLLMKPWLNTNRNM